MLHCWCLFFFIFEEMALYFNILSQLCVLLSDVFQLEQLFKLMMMTEMLVMSITKMMMLCLGDGGNDVSMIQAADAGVGIVGKVKISCCFFQDVFP